MEQDRRQFNRVVFNTNANFYDDDIKLECEIIDLSIKGVLLKLLSDTQLEAGGNYQLEIPLGSRNEIISMSLELMHQRGRHLGLSCSFIDLDSITHLRRLVELNLGDSEMLDRDFEMLIEDLS